MLTGLAAVFGIGGAALRARGERRYSTQLVNAAGLALVVFGLFAGLVGVFSFEGENPFGLGRGWEAVLVVGSLLVIAYGLFARERGPAWMGAVSFSFALAGVAGEGDETPTLVGWPLFLLAAALLVILASLRMRAAGR